MRSAQQVVHNGQGIQLVAAQFGAREAQAQVQLLGILFLGGLLAGEGRHGRQGLALARALPAAEEFLHQRQHLFGHIVARQGHHAVFRVIVLGTVGGQIPPGVRGNLLRGPQDGHARRLIPKLHPAEQLMHHILGGVLLHGDLLQDDAALLVQLPFIQGGVQGHVAEDVHRQGQILVNHLGVEAGAILARKGVELAAHRVHLLGNLPGIALLRPLKNHVLQKVRKPILPGLLHHGAHPQPHADGNRAQVRQPLAHHMQPVAQRPMVKHSLLHPSYWEHSRTPSMPHFFKIIHPARPRGRPPGEAAFLRKAPPPDPLPESGGYTARLAVLCGCREQQRREPSSNTKKARRKHRSAPCPRPKHRPTRRSSGGGPGEGLLSEKPLPRRFMLPNLTPGRRGGGDGACLRGGARGRCFHKRYRYGSG